MTTLTRQATWSRVGTDIRPAANINEALVLSKLDYQVDKVPLHLPSGAVIPEKFATVRHDTEEVFGIVGSDYMVCQNEQAFDFVNYIEEEVKFVKAGQTSGCMNNKGGMVYIIAELPERYVLGDAMKPYIIFQNGFNGYTPIKAAIAPLRIVCQNQFNMVFRQSDNAVKIGHFSNLEEKLTTARQVLRATASYMDQFTKEAETLAAINISGRESRIIESFYEISEDASDRMAEKVEGKRSELLNLYRGLDDNQNFRGTAWGLLNAFSDQLTHQLPGRQNQGWEETKFVSTTFNTAPMMRFSELLRAA